MKTTLWTLQGFLALHTLIAALWKWTNLETEIPTLAWLPHSVWLSFGLVELAAGIVLSLFLIRRSFWAGAVAANLFITTEMLLFSAIHLYSTQGQKEILIYWLLLATLSTSLAFAIWARALLGRRERSIHNFRLTH